MLTFISRAIGVVVVLVLSLVGLSTIAGRIFTWKDGHDTLYNDRKTPTVI